MHGSVAVRHASGPLPAMHHFPPIAVDSLHHHHANNHNSHQHMARIKAGVARTSSSSASSSSVSSGGAGKAVGAGDQSRSSSGSSSGVAERLAAGLERRAGGTAERSERLTPRRFLEKYSLPRVVRVVAEPGQGQRQGGPLAQPLLLYRQYSSCKVLARSLRRGGTGAGAGARDTKQDQQLGPPLVIPDTYQGWFSLVRERSLQTRARVYCSLQQLVAARVAVFLTKNSLTGFKLAPTPGADGDLAGVGPGAGAGPGAGRRLQYARSTVHGGQVLRLLAVFEDNETGRASTRSRSNRGLGLGLGLGRAAGGGRGQSQQYAQCLTARNESVFVPVATSGTFYAVATEDATDVSEPVSDADLCRVYQLPQLLRLTADPLPVKVQLVCGPIQNPLPAGFSGLLLLEELQREDVVLACTLPRSWALPPPSGAEEHSVPAPSSSAAQPAPSPGSTEKPIFLEMDADSKFLVTRPLASREAEARFFQTPLLRRVLAHCRDRADLWSSQIKVTHHVFPTGAEPAPHAPAPAPAASLTSRGSEPRAGSTASAVQGLFRSKESCLSSGGTKKSQSFRYASPAMMVSTGSSSSSSGSARSPGKAASGQGQGQPGAGQGGQVHGQVQGQGQGQGAGRLSRGRSSGREGPHHPLLQQLQSLPGIKNFLRRSSSVSPSPRVEDVPLSLVFPELFGHPPPPEPSPEDRAGADAAEGPGGAPQSGSPAGRGRQHLRFYADDLPYGRVADAIAPEVGAGAGVGAAAREYRRRKPRRRLYEEENSEDNDGDPVDDDGENIYAEICECPRGVVVSGARVILTTACSEERRGYFTFASATSKDQYYTGGSDGTCSGTMSSSNPSNPEEDIYDTVC